MNKNQQTENGPGWGHTLTEQDQNYVQTEFAFVRLVGDGDQVVSHGSSITALFRQTAEGILRLTGDSSERRECLNKLNAAHAFALDAVRLKPAIQSGQKK